MAYVRNQDDIERELTWWAYTLADKRFDLLENVVRAMADERGVVPPGCRRSINVRNSRPGADRPQFAMLGCAG
jgi:hypothetical protein